MPIDETVVYVWSATSDVKVSTHAVLFFTTVSGAFVSASVPDTRRLHEPVRWRQPGPYVPLIAVRVPSARACVVDIVCGSAVTDSSSAEPAMQAADAAAKAKTGTR